MKIASRIHNRDFSPRTVTINDRPYVFARTEDQQGNLHFVAEVKNEEHATILLGKPHFYVFGEELQPQATLRRNVEPASTGASTSTETTPVSTKPSAPVAKFSAEVTAEATALIAGKPAALGAAIGKVSTLDVVRAALELEKSGKGRLSVITLLEQTLEHAAAAGQV